MFHSSFSFLGNQLIKSKSHSHVCVRFFVGRPGQPNDLTKYIPSDEVYPVPRSIKDLESERMTLSLENVHQRKARKVPTNYNDFHLKRVQYNRLMHETRKAYKAEWDARVVRETNAIQEYRDNVKKQKELSRSVRATKKLDNVLQHEARVKEMQMVREKKRELMYEKMTQLESKLNEKKEKWLKELEIQSKEWIEEDKIDELITPDIFQMKYAPQFTKWFQMKEQKRILNEANRRALKPGKVLREVELSDKEYANDWESDAEESSISGSTGNQLMQMDDLAKYMRIGKIMKSLNESGKKGRQAEEDGLGGGGEHEGESRRSSSRSEEVDEDVFANLPRRRIVRNDEDKLALSKKKKVSAKELAGMRLVGLQPEELLGRKDKASLKKEYDEWQEEYGGIPGVNRTPEGRRE
jgi:hypothetical protein